MTFTTRRIMESLPDEIMILIFTYASTYDLSTSFQYVCTRWNYLINSSDRIWEGDVKIKGLTEHKCGTKLCYILRKTPRLKYLQIGNLYPNVLHERLHREYNDRTRDILNTIRVYNKEIEYLQIIDRSPMAESIPSIINEPKFKRLSVIFDRLCDRREKISDLRKIFDQLPEVDNLCVNFSQRIKFQCEKKGQRQWIITLDFKTDILDEFS